MYEDRKTVFSAVILGLIGITIAYLSFHAIAYALVHWISPLFGLRLPYLSATAYGFSIFLMIRAIFIGAGDILFPSYRHKPFSTFTGVLGTMVLLVVFLRLHPTEIGLPVAWDGYSPAAHYLWIVRQLPQLHFIFLYVIGLAFVIGIIVALGAAYLMVAVAWNLPHPDVYLPNAGKRLEDAENSYFKLNVANNDKAKKIDALTTENNALKTELDELKRRHEAQYNAWINDKGTLDVSSQTITMLKEQIDALKAENADLLKAIDLLSAKTRAAPKLSSTSQGTSIAGSKLERLIDPDRDLDG